MKTNLLKNNLAQQLYTLVRYNRDPSNITKQLSDIAQQVGQPITSAQAQAIAKIGYRQINQAMKQHQNDFRFCRRIWESRSKRSWESRCKRN